jgi:hypothetical protein
MADPKSPPPPLDAWLRVTFDDDGVTLEATPPGREPWRQSFAWSSVVRVCFKPESLASDGIFVFTRERPESYVIPVEASGGGLFFDELITRGLFGAEMAIEAASATEGIFCWPPQGVRLPDQRQTRCRPPEPAGKPEFDAEGLAAYLRERLPDREHLVAGPRAELLEEIAAGGLTTLGELDAIVESTREAVARFEADQAAKGHGPLADVGVVRVALRIFDPRFLRAAEWHFMTEEGLAASDAEQYAGYRHLVRWIAG